MAMNARRLLAPQRKTGQRKPRYVLCIKNKGYEASLEKRKVYRLLPDRRASAHDLVRIVDESGEDYLYPREWFAPISLPRTIVKALAS